ncbi:PREDICTED: WAS/WASL-interacting protein family member 1-like [Nipponia nippon]|uniref:WAS/WASL-interacting protein family member 1-like n=1 Tax=Nipponia nippon TaxID=128390 RepID=UPI000510B120|nr:PREDICTED: WAS/WASL-interacting protein family member 1-like [Nipponia nippon]
MGDTSATRSIAPARSPPEAAELPPPPGPLPRRPTPLPAGAGQGLPAAQHGTARPGAARLLPASTPHFPGHGGGPRPPHATVPRVTASQC